MQGFNKYYPPDYDPAVHETLNDYRGKHALGDRARKIDKGILIVRFELPFNIWCGGCDAHIGAGVRYNAEKKKAGSYFSTTIWGFRCKCHLCSHWFEIRTDPQNAAYVVHEGARRKHEEWDPIENGGYAIQDTEKPSTADADAFSQLEKTTTQLAVAQTQAQRLASLYELSEATTADPYTLSSRLRTSFRAEKKERVARELVDEGLKKRLGLGEGMKLLEGLQGEGSGEWRSGRDERERSRVGKGKGRETRTLAIEDGSTTAGTVERLRKEVVGNSRRRWDPFAAGGGAAVATLARIGASKKGIGGSLPKPKGTMGAGKAAERELKSKAGPSAGVPRLVPPVPTVRALGLVDGYGSD